MVFNCNSQILAPFISISIHIHFVFIYPPSHYPFGYMVQVYRYVCPSELFIIIVLKVIKILSRTSVCV